MKVVIIPTDFSENAFNALTCAIQYFKNEDARFMIVHTYEEGQEDSTEFEDKMDHLLERVEYLKYDPHHKYSTHIIKGHLITEINRIVDTENADLVIMGTRGNTDNRRVSFGSNTLQVMKNVSCPMLAIPLELEFKIPETVLFPSDLMIPFQDRELELVNSIICNYGSKMLLAHISKFDKLSNRQEKVKAMWDNRFRESETTYKRLESGVPTVIINNYIKEYHVDLLIMVHSKHSFLESFLAPPTIDSLGLNLTIPFLILQNIPR